MSSSLKWIGGILILILLVGVIAGAYFLYSHLTQDYKPGDFVENSYNSTQNESDNTQPDSSQTQSNQAPDFTVTDKNGNTISLSDFRGKAVVVNFWASWCPPCKAEMPDFQSFYNQYGDDVEFMMVNMTDGQRETEERAKAHISESGYTFPVYFDTYFSAANAYQVTSIPRTYFINADGTIATAVPGMIDGTVLKNGIDMIK